MPLPVIAVALVAVEITAEDALLVAGGTVLLIGLQSQLNNYLNNNHIKNYRSVSPQEISSRSYKQIFVIPDFGQQLLLFSSQLQIEWVKRKYCEWQNQIQGSKCSIQDELQKFMMLLKNRHLSSCEIYSLNAYYLSKGSGFPDPNKNKKDKEKKDEKKKDNEHSSIKEKGTQVGKQMQEGQPSSSSIIDKIRFSTGGNNPMNPFN